VSFGDSLLCPVRAMEEVIGHYKRETLTRALTSVVVALLLYAVSIYQVAHAGLQYYFDERPLVLLVLLGAWPLGLVVLFAILVSLKRMLLDHGKAVWVSDGRITFLHRWVTSIPFSNIVEMTVGTYGRSGREGILFKLRNGQTKVIPTGSLVEPAESLLENLQRRCKLPGTGSE
jgi:hypothetical protein